MLWFGEPVDVKVIHKGAVAGQKVQTQANAQSFSKNRSQKDFFLFLWYHIMVIVRKCSVALLSWTKGLYPCSTKTREVLGNPSPTSKRFPETREISRGRSPRDFPRAKPDGNLEGRGKSWGRTSTSTDILSSSIFLQGEDQKILPCGQGRIDSVRINPSLLMMRQWIILLYLWLHQLQEHRCSGANTGLNAQKLFISGLGMEIS